LSISFRSKNPIAFSLELYISKVQTAVKVKSLLKRVFIISECLDIMLNRNEMGEVIFGFFWTFLKNI